MKKLLLSALFLLLCATLQLQAQTGDEGKDFPEVKVKNLEGAMISTGDFENDGKPIIVSFWATWCKPCILELTTIHDEYPDWVEETGVKLIAISIDDARNSGKVKPFVDGRGWEYEVYIDENQDLKRALGVNNVPHTFLLDGNKKIVHSHAGYTPGDEEALLEHVREVAEHK